MLLGAIYMLTSMLFSSCAHRGLFYTIFIPSIVTGFGMGLCFTVAYFIPHVYFKKHRQQAITIHATCVGLGTIITPLLISVLLRAGITWRGTMIWHLCLIFVPLLPALYCMVPVKRSTDDGDSSKPEANADKSNANKSSKVTDRKELNITMEEKPIVTDEQSKASAPCKTSQDGSQKKEAKESDPDPNPLVLFNEAVDEKLEKLTWSNAWLFGLYALATGGAGGIFYTFTPYILSSDGLKEGHMYLVAPFLSICPFVVSTIMYQSKSRFNYILNKILSFVIIAVCVTIMVSSFRISLPFFGECTTTTMRMTANLTQLMG